MTKRVDMGWNWTGENTLVLPSEHVSWFRTSCPVFRLTKLDTQKRMREDEPVVPDIVETVCRFV